jgi:hypothetical protein
LSEDKEQFVDIELPKKGKKGKIRMTGTLSTEDASSECLLLFDPEKNRYVLRPLSGIVRRIASIHHAKKTKKKMKVFKRVVESSESSHISKNATTTTTTWKKDEQKKKTSKVPPLKE